MLHRCNIPSHQAEARKQAAVNLRNASQPESHSGYDDIEIYFSDDESEQQVSRMGHESAYLKISSFRLILKTDLSYIQQVEKIMGISTLRGPVEF